MRNTVVGLLASYNRQPRIFLLILMSIVLQFIDAAIISKASEVESFSNRYLEPTAKTVGAARTAADDKEAHPSVKVLYRGTAYQLRSSRGEKKTVNEIPSRNEWPGKESPLENKRIFRPLEDPSKTLLKEEMSSTEQSLKEFAPSEAQRTTAGLHRSEEPEFQPENAERRQRVLLAQEQINDQIRKNRHIATQKQMEVSKQFVTTPHVPAAKFRQEFLLAGAVRPGEQFHPTPSPYSRVPGPPYDQFPITRFMHPQEQMSVGSEFAITQRAPSLTTFTQEIQPPVLVRPNEQFYPAPSPHPLVHEQINDQMQNIRSMPPSQQTKAGWEIAPPTPPPAMWRQDIPHGTSAYDRLNRGNRGHPSVVKEQIHNPPWGWPPGFSRPQSHNTPASIYIDQKRYADRVQKSHPNFNAASRQNFHPKKDSMGSVVPGANTGDLITEEDFEAVLKSLALD